MVTICFSKSKSDNYIMKKIRENPKYIYEKNMECLDLTFNTNEKELISYICGNKKNKKYSDIESNLFVDFEFIGNIDSMNEIFNTYFGDDKKYKEFVKKYKEGQKIEIKKEELRKKIENGKLYNDLIKDFDNISNKHENKLININKYLLESYFDDYNYIRYNFKINNFNEIDVSGEVFTNIKRLKEEKPSDLYEVYQNIRNEIDLYSNEELIENSIGFVENDDGCGIFIGFLNSEKMYKV